MTTFGNHLFDRVISVAILEVLCFPAEIFWYIDYLIDSDSFGNQPLSKSVNIQKGIHSMTELSTVKSSAVKALAMEYKNLQEEPLEGFQVKLAKEESLFEWDVVIFGPPETLYQGGYFKAKMRFPLDYPFSPPSVKFTTKVWHPNIYDSGDICISILHPPVDDPQSGELPCERWNPTQTVRTILLSVVSLLNEPNTFSPANVDASVMYRRWRESKGHDKEYEEIIRRQVAASREEAARDSVEVPLTLEDYTRASRLQRERAVPAAEISDFFEDMTGDDEDNDTDQDASITTQGYENDQEGS